MQNAGFTIAAPSRCVAQSVVQRRPQTSKLVCIFGESNAGKTATIHSLMRDSSTTLTKLAGPTVFSKTIETTGSNAQVCKNIRVVEFPSFAETTTEQVDNLAILFKLGIILDNCFANDNVETFVASHSKVHRPVFPNVVLYCINASDNRLEQNSLFRKSLELLKEVPNLIDMEYPNLIFFLTNCMVWGREGTVFQEKLNQMTRIIFHSIKDVFGFHKAYVVPVENFPDHFNLPFVNDTHILPNKEAVPDNVFSVIKENLREQGDLESEHTLPNLFCSNVKLENLVSYKLHGNVTNVERDSAFKLLLAKGIPINPAYGAKLLQFNFLGKGFCPRFEKVFEKNSLISNTASDTHQVSIYGNHCVVPKSVKVQENLKILSRHNLLAKEEYEELQKESYELEPDMGLNVSATLSEKWTEPSRHRQGPSVQYFYCHEIQVATLKILDPVENITCPEFLSNLNSLPETYDVQNWTSFTNFFLNWGTHMIYEVGLGGSIKVSYNLTTGYSMNPVSETMIIDKIKYSLTNLLETSSLNTLICTELEHIGISNVRIDFVGGHEEISQVKSSSLTAGKLQEWFHSLKEKLVELPQSFKLLSYANCTESLNQRASLSDAIKATLSQEPNSFTYLGKGFCPRREKSLGNSLLSLDKIVSIDDITQLKLIKTIADVMLVPSCISYKWFHDQTFRRVTFRSQVEYEESMKTIFRLDQLSHGLKLKTAVESEGRWLSAAQIFKLILPNVKNDVTYQMDFKVASFEIENPNESNFNKDFISVLERLPKYRDDVEEIGKYKHFFDEYGTHFVRQVDVGGTLLIKYPVSFSKDNDLNEATAKMKRFIDVLGGNGMQLDVDTKCKTVSLYGGERSATPPFSYDEILEWTSTLFKYPKELLYSVLLHPYYELPVVSPKSFEFKLATEKYLSGEIDRLYDYFEKQNNSQSFFD